MTVLSSSKTVFFTYLISYCVSRSSKAGFFNIPNFLPCFMFTKDFFSHTGSYSQTLRSSHILFSSLYRVASCFPLLVGRLLCIAISLKLQQTLWEIVFTILHSKSCTILWHSSFFSCLFSCSNKLVDKAERLDIILKRDITICEFGWLQLGMSKISKNMTVWWKVFPFTVIILSESHHLYKLWSCVFLLIFILVFIVVER